MSEDNESHEIEPTRKSWLDEMSVEDKFTMEFMMNKRMFKRCLDPEKYEESMMKVEKLRRMKSSILELTSELLDDFIRSANLYKNSMKMNDVFAAYTDLCIEFLEKKAALENDDGNDDTLFGMEVPRCRHGTISRHDSTEASESNSFWGKTIRKTS